VKGPSVRAGVRAGGMSSQHSRRSRVSVLPVRRFG
jgi:hypothetical protein